MDFTFLTLQAYPQPSRTFSERSFSTFKNVADCLSNPSIV